MIKKFWSWFFQDYSFTEVVILPEVVEDICALAKSSWPKETVQFLTGDIKDGVLTVDGLYLKSYEADRNSAWFTTHDLPMLGVLGTVHSHPSSRNEPSAADKRMFGRIGSIHLIVGAPYTASTIACYDKNGERISYSHGTQV